MNIENIVSDALALPVDAVSYFVSRELGGLYPLRSVVEGEGGEFGLREYEEAGLCSVRPAESVHNQIATAWYGEQYGLYRSVENGLYHVEWQGHALEVLFITWTEGVCRSRHHWILADAKETAEQFFEAVCRWNSEVRGEVLVFDNGHWAKSEALFQAIKSATFDNLVLPGFLKQEIQDDFNQFFASREVYERYRLPWKRGVLFIGPPGNGKTHTVKALINWLGKPCLYVKSLKARYATDHETIHAVFDRARQTTPCILILEDLDSLLTDRNRSFFLNELDGFAANTGVVVLATTNHPDRLDPAILDRPSRFDRKYYFELPEPSERLTYVQKWNESLEKDLRLTADGIGQVVDLTDGFSYAYLKELFLSSMMRWIASPAADAMDTIMFAQASLLREQMASVTLAPAEDEEETTEEDW